MQTKGEYLVGANFNPSGNNLVDQIKRKAADLIDTISQIEASNDAEHSQISETHRCRSLAITNIEQGAMWAVKSATKPAQK